MVAKQVFDWGGWDVCVCVVGVGLLKWEFWVVPRSLMSHWGQRGLSSKSGVVWVDQKSIVKDGTNQFVTIDSILIFAVIGQ